MTCVFRDLSILLVSCSSPYEGSTSSAMRAFVLVSGYQLHYAFTVSVSSSGGHSKRRNLHKRHRKRAPLHESRLPHVNRDYGSSGIISDSKGDLGGSA